MTRTSEVRAEEIQRQILAELRSELTTKQSERIDTIFPSGVPSEKLDDVIGLCERTITSNKMKKAIRDRSEPTKERTLDGKPIHLDALCRHEPAWAANRIRANEKAIADLVALLREVLLPHASRKPRYWQRIEEAIRTYGEKDANSG